MLVSKVKNKLKYFLLLIIFIVGFWLRFSGIIKNSFAFTYDVGRDLLAVKSIVVDYKPTLLGPTTGLEGLFYGPWWYYFLAVPFSLSGGNPQVIASFIALLGLSNIFLAYVLGKKIGNSFLGLTLASLISFSPLMVGSSVQIWNPNLIPFLVLVTLFSLYQIFNQKKNYFLILGLSLGLIIELQIVFGMLFFLGILLSVIFFLRDKFISKGFFLFLFGFLFIMLPRLLFELRHDFLMTRSVIRFGKAGVWQQEVIPLSQRLFNRGQIFQNLWLEAVGGQNGVLGLALLIFGLFALFLFYQKTNRIEKIFLKTIFVVLLTFFIGLALYQEAVWSHYLVGLPVLFIFFLALALKLFKENFKEKRIAILLLLIVIWLNLKPHQILIDFKKPLWEGDAAVYRNQLAVLDYIYKEAKGEDFNYIVYTPPLHDYNYRYLLDWYGKKKYGYPPSQEKTALFFVILEPDYQFPQRLKDWLEIRRDDGKIIKEEIVKGGITVQTRIL